MKNEYNETTWLEVGADVMKILLVVVGVVGVIIGFSALGGYVLMLLWNFALPSLFGLPALDFYKAWALTLLLGFIGNFFKSSSTSSSSK